MKSKILTLLVISFLSVTVINGQNIVKKNNPVGTWRFEAPYAPEGYTSGAIVVGLPEQKHTATMVFYGSEYKLTGEKVKIEKDSLFFVLYHQGEEITISLKIEDELKMTGKAVYSQGEVPLSLVKTVDLK